MPTTTTSSNVTTQTCTSEAGEPSELALPRFDGNEQQADLLNDLALQIEAAVNERAIINAPCEICPTNGAIIIDCTKCREFDVFVTADINSISMVNCDAGEGIINFLVPTGVSRRICGWPERFGFEGNECFEGAISGGSGAAGRMFSIPFGGRGGRGAQVRIPAGGGVPTAGGGAGGGGCACTPATAGTLTIVCCTSGCDIDCDTNKSLDLRVCGGVPPYSWASTQGTLDGTAGSSITLVPPATSTVAGKAYEEWNHEIQCTACGSPGCGPGGGTCPGGSICCHQYSSSSSSSVNGNRTDRGCEDEDEGTGTGNLGCADACKQVSGGCNYCGPGIAGNSNCSHAFGTDPCTVDTRTAQMITDGCKPCRLVMDGAVVTVTDATGISASKTITVT